MKKLRYLSIICPIIALVCEILPFGAVLNFWNPEGEPYRQTCSYFDLTPFGYANFAPLITAVLTCIILIMTVIFIVKPKKTAAKILAVLSLIASVVSLMPLLYGLSFFSPVGAVISAVLIINTVISAKMINEKSAN